MSQNHFDWKRTLGPSKAAINPGLSSPSQNHVLKHHVNTLNWIAFL